MVEKGKLILQLGTDESALALRAATTVIRDVDGINVNMGCPKKFSVSGGMGSALLSDVRRACDVITTLRNNIPQGKTVSAKVRLLHPTDPRPTLTFVRALIKAGANAIAIHGRVVGDECHTMARWSTLVDVVRHLKDTEARVPIIVNGDLYTRADIREMKRRSMCDGVMLARPALYNVSLFRRGGEEREGENGIPGVEDGYDGGGVYNDERRQGEKGEGDETTMPLSQFQTTKHGGYYGYTSPLLHTRTSIVQEYLTHCVRYRAHSKNAKYVVLEMMNIRRAPTHRVPSLNMTYAGGQTIDTVCKCRSLDDLVKVWDVRYTNTPTTPPTTASSTSTYQTSSCSVGNNSSGMPVTTMEENTDTPAHNYDDRYFLDHNAFRREMGDDNTASAIVYTSHQVDTPSNDEDGDDTKTTDVKNNGCEVDASVPVHASKRLKGTQ